MGVTGRARRGRAQRGAVQGGVAQVADTALRLAMLLGAGAVPETAWRHLAESGDPAAERISGRIAGGQRVGDAIEAEGAVERPARRAEGAAGAAWRDIAAAWEIASTVGAPLAEALRALAAALRDAQEALDDVRVALAEPAHTARLMSALPFIGLLIAAALGFDVLGVLLSPGAGLACLLTGLALIVCARLWTSRLVRAAQPAPGTPGLRAELMAIALGGGVSLDRARALVAERATESPDDEIERVVDLSRRAGIPAIELLRATAMQQRHDARTTGRVSTARLGTRLLLPLGVCTLPAFLCLGVVPMLLAVLRSAPLPELP